MVDSSQYVVVAYLKMGSSGTLRVVGMQSGMVDRAQVNTYGENIQKAVRSAYEAAVRSADEAAVRSEGVCLAVVVPAEALQGVVHRDELQEAVNSVNVSHVVHLANSEVARQEEVYLAEVRRNSLVYSTSHFIGSQLYKLKL